MLSFHFIHIFLKWKVLLFESFLKQSPFFLQNHVFWVEVFRHQTKHLTWFVRESFGGNNLVVFIIPFYLTTQYFDLCLLIRANIKATLLWVNEKFQPFYLAFHYFDFCSVIRSNIKGTLVWVNMKRMSFNLELWWRAVSVISLEYPMPALICGYKRQWQIRVRFDITR